MSALANTPATQPKQSVQYNTSRTAADAGVKRGSVSTHSTQHAHNMHTYTHTAHTPHTHNTQHTTHTNAQRKPMDLFWCECAATWARGTTKETINPV